MARAAKASTAPKGKAAPAAASQAKTKAVAPAKGVKSKGSPPQAPVRAKLASAKVAPAPAKLASAKLAPVKPAPAKASKAATSKATTPLPAPVKSSRAKASVATPAPAPVKQPAVTMKHLAADLSDSHSLSRREAESFADELVSDMVERMRSGAKVRIAGLGILEIKDKPARMARNPATGASVQVAASRKVTFRVTKALKESI